MTIDDKIRDVKLVYDINREAAKISALSSGKINKYGYLTGEEVYIFSFRKTFRKTIRKRDWCFKVPRPL